MVNPVPSDSELVIRVSLDDEPLIYTRDEVGVMLGKAESQGYRQGYADAVEQMPVPQPSGYMQ